ncbi:MAG TPA: HRDC domain-containing protein [Methylomirabilota bacterium]|nr:HRDC domain-containing protein [Methylomirabilota bacterium]
MLDDLSPIWVDTAEGLCEVAGAVAEVGRMALDTEADSLHSYFHKVCLIQVTANGRNFVIDPLALEPDDLRPLWDVVEDPELPVLMHGADYDLRVLDRDYGVRIRGLQDTQTMAQVLGEPKTGLATLLERDVGVALDKRHQRADWGRRPLTRSQVVYAAADTAFLGRLAAGLRARLEELGRWSWAVEEFGRLEEVRFEPPEPDPLAFERVKGVRVLRGAARDRAYSLVQWRDLEAQRLDTPPFKVLGNAPLVALASSPPATVSELAEVDGIGPRFSRRWGREVVALLARPETAPAPRRGRRELEPPPVVVKRTKRLAAARDRIAAELGIEPGLLCPRACLTGVASRRPRCTSRRDLERSGLGGWRLEILGEPFLEALTEG